MPPQTGGTPRALRPDRLTLIAISALAYVVGAAYWWVVRLSARRMGGRVSGVGRDRIRAARLTGLDSYLTGVVVFSAIGALNSDGLVIVAASAVGVLANAAVFGPTLRW